jgi:hypothetical protein
MPREREKSRKWIVASLPLLENVRNPYVVELVTLVGGASGRPTSAGPTAQREKAAFERITKEPRMIAAQGG